MLVIKYSIYLIKRMGVKCYLVGLNGGLLN